MNDFVLNLFAGCLIFAIGFILSGRVIRGSPLPHSNLTNHNEIFTGPSGPLFSKPFTKYVKMDTEARSASVNRSGQGYAL